MDIKAIAVVGVALILTFANAQNSCPDNQVYKECGSACPITCANKDNPPIFCPLVCVSGCFCVDNYYKAANGSCVTEDGCNSSPACPNNQVFSECGSNCPQTCANLNDPDPPLCTQQCIAKCTCPTGMVSTNSGICVTPDNCPTTATEPPTQVCPNNTVFSNCGSACPLTCANKNDPPVCTEECVVGCACPSGMVATDDGICVTPDNCPMTTPESCQLPPEPGLCKASIPSYFYNSTAGNCHMFIYGGCQGNDNRYTTYQECMNTCSQVPIGLPAVAAEYTTKETCPVIADSIGTCEESCATDDNCSSSQLCCSNGCGHSCAETTSLPYYSPPMSCPGIDPLFGIFCTLDFGCKGHDQCGSGELCCPTGCGSICKTAVIPTPLCTEVNAQASSSALLGTFVPECDSQGNFSLVQCHEGMCWCADPVTGVPTSSPVMFGEPDCGQSTCEYNGNTYTEGQSFPSIDGCNTCFCSGGGIGCTKIACPCEYNGNTYTGGQSFPSADGCNTCFCSGGVVACTLKACIPLSKNCEINGQVYDNGTTFLASDGCNTCYCLDGDASCTEMGCLCQAGGLEVVAGSPLDIGCAVCDCIWAIQQINCSPKDDESCVPTKQTKRVSMRFTGDYDSIDDMDRFEEAVRSTLVDLYGSTMGLRREQITNIEVTRGSIVIGLTLQDVDEGANVTLLVVQMHNDYNNKSIVIIYQELVLTPAASGDDSDFSVEDEDEDQDEGIGILFIIFTVIAAVILALTVCVVILTVVVVRTHRKKSPFTQMGSPQSCAIDENDYYEMKADLSKSDKA